MIKKLNLIVVLTIVFCLALISVGSVSAEVINLKMSTAFTLHTNQEVGARQFIDYVEKYAGDKVKINYTGGPEAIPPFELIDALNSGIVDIAGLPASYFQSHVEEVGAMYLSQKTPWQERENGAYDLFEEIIASKLDVKYLGRYNSTYEFNFYTNKKVENLSDFEGLKLRVSPVYRAFLSKLEGTPVNMSHSEVFTALERGVVDGLGATNFGVMETGWYEKIKYVIDPSFYGSDQVLLFNKQTWEKLPQDLKDFFEMVIIKVEKDSGEELAEIIKEERVEIVDEGIIVLTMPNPDEFREMAYDSAWDNILNQCPEYGTKMKELIN